jgi:hypothetical protein
MRCRFICAYGKKLEANHIHRNQRLRKQLRRFA